jgi:hypothetical protein
MLHLEGALLRNHPIPPPLPLLPSRNTGTCPPAPHGVTGAGLERSEGREEGEERFLFLETYGGGGMGVAENRYVGSQGSDCREELTPSSIEPYLTRHCQSKRF